MNPLSKENLFALNNYAAYFNIRSKSVLNPSVHTKNIFNVILRK